MFPPDWEDDERMSFLFSAFKENREVDCTDWDGKMGFWSPLVVEQCRRSGAVCVSLQELHLAFRRKGAVPLGLSIVLQSMIRSGKVQKEADFVASVDSGWLSWGVGLLVVRPLKWTLSALLGSGRVPLEESFVVLELVKEKAAALLEAYRSSWACERPLLSFPELRALSSDVCPDESTLCLALLQLQREKMLTVSLHEGEKLVKFSGCGRGRVSPISELDLGIYQLRRSEKLLEERVELLGLEVEKCKKQTKALLKEGKKTQALRCLRGAKRVEKKADRLFAQLETVKGILDRIANSQTDRLVMQAYQAGVAVLRVSLKGVTVERAENLVDQIQELCDTQEDVSKTLAGGSFDFGDDSDLEEELKSLMEKVAPEAPGLSITDEELDRELSRIHISEDQMAVAPAGSSSPPRVPAVAPAGSCSSSRVPAVAPGSSSSRVPAVVAAGRSSPPPRVPAVAPAGSSSPPPRVPAVAPGSSSSSRVPAVAPGSSSSSSPRVPAVVPAGSSSPPPRVPAVAPGSSSSSRVPAVAPGSSSSSSPRVPAVAPAGSSSPPPHVPAVAPGSSSSSRVPAVAPAGSSSSSPPPPPRRQMESAQ